MPHPSIIGPFVTVDLPPVTADEAVELCLHHLAMAAAYFEATPRDNNIQVLAELRRLSTRSILGMEDPRVLGSRAFLAAALAYYAEEDRKEAQ